jgi:DNA-binding response OmpR family regulator
MTVVLVADADDLILRLLTQTLGIFGFEVVSARNGVMALEIVERIRPVVAVLDAALPGIDGIHVARLVAESQATPRTRVLLLAASADDLDLANRSHADAVLRKPFGLQDLVAQVRALSGGADPSGE